MTVTFLGTGTSQGVPVIGCSCNVCTSLDFRDKRLRTSIYIAIENQRFVVDTGPDFRQQMLREDICKIDAVIFTHAHRDHTAGLDDIRAYNFIQEAPMPLYGSADVLNQLRLEYKYAFAENKYPGTPTLELYEIGSQAFSINNIPIIPLPVLHYKLPVLGFRFQNFSYITDANYIPDETFQRMKGTDVLVINALQLAPHISHFNLEEAIQIVDKIKPNKAYFTHISHKLGKHTEIEKKLSSHISLAYDGLEVTCT